MGGFKSVCLVGTQNTSKQTNLAIFSSLVHIGAHPPLIGLIFRPDSVARHSLDNIQKTGFYTINHIREEFAKKAHQTSARYSSEESEFDATELTATYKNDFLAPYVNESIVQFGMELKEIIPIELNGTLLVIGQVIHIYFPENCLHESGFLDLHAAGTITCAGLDAYYNTTPLFRLSYAKPAKEITLI
jgi:flavin reductase (DIM6/NTAB) family NADH-FMN oxidoreductase RutF